MRSTVRDFEGRGLAGAEEMHRLHARATDRKLAENLAGKRVKFRADAVWVCWRSAALAMLGLERVADDSIWKHCPAEMGRCPRKRARPRRCFSSSTWGIAVRRFI